jgi:hypothetical protein
MSRFVEKLRVRVRLALAGCAPVDGFLVLGPRAEHRDGPETLADRLNARTRVVPFLRAEDEALLLIVRTHIEWVLADAAVAPTLVRAAHYQHTSEERVRVRLAGGAALDGVLAFEMPHEFNRASDFMNAEDDFLALQTSQGTMLVRKDAVLDVRLFEDGADRRAA